MPAKKRSTKKVSEPVKKQPPVISKFAPDETAIPTGTSSITIIHDTDDRTLTDATSDANEALASMLPEGAERIEVVVEPVQQSDTSLSASSPLEEREVSASVADYATAPLLETDDDQSAEPALVAPVTDTLQQTPIADVEEDGLPDDELTNKAVDEIIAEEGDVVLAAEDMVLQEENAEFTEADETEKSGFRAFFTSAKFRWSLFLLLLIGLGAVGLVPKSRYFVLNSANVRSGLSVRVIDGTTQQPLKNVSVRAGGATTTTDSEGNASLSSVRLGPTKLVIEKRAFATIERDIVVGWGSNPLGEFIADAVGVQYTLLIKDYLTGLPIDGAEASSGDGNAKADDTGKLVLTLDTAGSDESEQFDVEVTAPGYRQEVLSLSVSNKEEQGISMVPGKKHLFVSKRSGTYDVYRIDIDGKNEEKLVAGTGVERDDIALVPHQKESLAALVATRERAVNSSGYLLSTLYVVETDTGELTKIDQSEKIQIVGWDTDGRLIYVKIASGASAIDPDRHRIVSVNTKNITDVKELASSNAFNDIVMAWGRVFYAPSNVFQETMTPGTYVVNTNGENKQTILDQEAFALQRTTYDVLDISAGDKWFQFKVDNPGTAISSTAPLTQTSRQYFDNIPRSRSLWVDQRDGKGVLLSYDMSTKQETVLTSQNGLKTPVYWLNDSVAVYRVQSSKETADYAVSVRGGEPQKISDVTNAAGVERWFYY